MTFKVVPLRAHTHAHTHTHTHTLAPSILPLLETPAEGFFWNLPEFGRRIRFDVLHGCETRPLAEKSNPVVTQPPYSPDLAPSDFGCWLLWKWTSRGRVSLPWRTSNLMQRPNSGRFQKKPSAGASNNVRIDGTSVCVCVCVCARARARAHGSCFERD